MNFTPISDRTLVNICIFLAVFLTVSATELKAEQSDADQIQALIEAEDYEQAEIFGRTALESAQADSIEAPLILADVEAKLAELLLLRGRYTDGEAQQLAEHSLGLRKQADVPAETISMSLRLLAGIHHRRREFPVAADYYRQALKVADTDSRQNRGEILADLGSVERRLGHFDLALELINEGISILEEFEDTSQLAIAKACINRGVVLRAKGDLGAARGSYERALEIRRTELGERHEEVALVLNNLGNVHRDQGHYLESWKCLESALEIWTESLRPDHPKLAFPLLNLGIIANIVGDYDRSLELGLQALEIREKNFDPESLAVGQILENIGYFEMQRGDQASAFQYQWRALRIRQKAQGEDHPDLAENYKQVGSLLVGLDRFEEAEPLLQRAIALRREHVGDESLHTAHAVSALAGLRVREGKYTDALAMLDESIPILRREIKGMDSTTSGTLYARSKALYALGRDDEAMSAVLELLDLERQSRRATMRGLSEREALAFEERSGRALDLALSIYLESNSMNAGSLRAIWDRLVRDRASVLDEMVMRRQLWREQADDDTRAMITELQKLRKELARQTLRTDADEEDLAESRRMRRDLEHRLAAKSALFSRTSDMERIGLDDVDSKLGAEDALVAFLRFRRLDRQLEQHDEYAAFVMYGAESRTELLVLGSAEETNRDIGAWWEQAALGSGDSRGIVRVAPEADEREQVYRAVGNTLRARIWDPIAPVVAGARRVFFVPDDRVNLVNFYALPMEEHSYLVETGVVFHGLSSERSLGIVDAAVESGRGLLAFGGPNYDLDLAATTEDTENDESLPRLVELATSFHKNRSARSDFAALVFDELPGSRVEAGVVKTMWKGEGKARVLVGSEARESSFKALAPGQSVLHLATHAFFLGESDSDSESSRVERAVADQLLRENPLLQSGLAFAGANQRHHHDSTDEDGILTADEVAMMDLSSVDWAVLSACNTGGGTIVSGEGVLGLRRAFELAGARTVITSLWPVDDVATVDWMTQLYAARFSNSMTTSSAVHSATLHCLEKRRLNGESTHPSLWAGFVAAGDWR